ncbi:MAG: hypothetical protein GY856_07125 [bacterium]|nr:hypothetical protein [bacterium]
MWLSLHIYHGEDPYGDDLDRLAVFAVAPLVEQLEAEGWIERFFFVRYIDPPFDEESRCHLRLRLRLRSRARAEATSERVRAMVAELNETAIERGAAPAEVRRIDYVPEWRRYGGKHGVPVAEEHFHLSSRIALETLAATVGQDVSRRLGKAVLTAVLLVRGLDPDRHAVTGFLRWYSENYLRYVIPSQERRGAFRDRLTELAAGQGGLDGEALAGALEALLTVAEAGQGFGVSLLDRWTTDCAAIIGRLRELASEGALELPAPAPDAGTGLESIIASYLHMHHNRLGVAIPQEVYLTHLAADALVRQEAAP